MFLESHTLLATAVLATCVMAAAHFVLWTYDRSQTAPLWMAVATLACGTSALLREALPEREAIVVANVLLAFGLASIATACRVLCGRHPALFPLVLPAMAWLSACTFPAFMGDQQTRSVASSLSCMGVMAWAVMELWHAGPERVRARIGLMLVLVVQGLAALARAIAIAVSDLHPQGVARTADVTRTTFWSFGCLLLIGFGTMFFVKEQSERRLRQVNDEDPLTGLANRRRLDAELDAALGRATLERHSVSVLMIDADAFKAYNDRYGHVAGDKALQFIARILAETASEVGGIAARYGGEEFVILLPDIDAAAAHRVGEAARIGVRDAGIEHSASPHGVVTISIGAVSAIPATRTRARDFLAAADKALYDAKHAGRDQVKPARLPLLDCFPLPDVLSGSMPQAGTAQGS